MVNRPDAHITNTAGEWSSLPDSRAIDAPLYDSADQEMRASLREIGRVLRRRKWTILLVTMVVTALAGAYVTFTEANYEAYTILLVDPPSQESAEDPLRSGRIGALDRHRRNMTDQTLLLQQSLPIATRTVRHLQRSWADIAGPATLLEAATDGDTSLTQTAERLLGAYVSAEREDRQEGNALRVTATSTNPHEAAFLANAYTQAYLDLSEERSRRQITAAQAFLETQLSRQKEKLQALEEELASYESRTRAAGLEEVTRQTVQQMGMLEARLDEARVAKRRAEAALRSVQSELDEIRPKLAARVSSGVDEEITRTQSRIADLEGRLEQIYIRNPEFRDRPRQSEDVLALEGQISDLRRHADRLTKQYIDEMMAVGGTDPFTTAGGDARTYVAQLKRTAAEERVAISGAEARIDALQQRLDQYRERMTDIPERSTQISRLRRERAAAEETYDALTRKLQDVQLAREATISMAEVVRPALVPESSTMPRAIIVLGGVLLGLSIGGVTAVVRHKVDTRIYTPEDLAARNFRLIGVVPELDLAGEAPARLLPVGRSEETGKRDGADTGGQATPPPPALQNPPAVSESYRRLHLNLQRSREESPVRSVVVTSPEPGAGKSTTALYLAATAARAGRRTLLVDADFRQPKIQALTGTSERPTMADLLADPESDPAHVARATSVPNLFAISHSAPTEDADLVLSSPQLEHLFSRMIDAFDLVVFDTPPVLAVADAVLLATRSDATVIVVKAGRTELEELEQTSEELRDARAEIVGTVLNQFNPAEPSSYTARYQYQNLE